MVVLRLVVIAVGWGVCVSCVMGGVRGWHFHLAFKIQCHWFTIFQGVSIKQDFGVQPFDLIIAWVPFGLLILCN